MKIMKPYGLADRKKHNFVDNHIKGKAKRQGFVNWWEAEVNTSKKRVRRRAKKDIEKEYDSFIHRYEDWDYTYRKNIC